MSYRVLLTEEAERHLAALPPHLQQLVETHLERLGDAPSEVSHRVVSPPHPPGGMVYEFASEIDRRWHYFSIFFLYGQDEESLGVIAIAHH